MVSLSNKDVILVTGGTGRIGRLVVEDLLRIGASVRVLTRHPEEAKLPIGAEVVRGDFTTPASLTPALEGISTVFLVWTAAPTTAPAVIQRLAEQRRHIVYLSAPFRTPHPFFQQPNPMRDLHEAVERFLAVSSLEVTIIRPGMFASNALHWWAPQIRNGNVVRWPYANVETAPVDERDVAAVTARLLTESRHAGGDYVLTGSESLNQAEQIHIIGNAIGRQLRFEELSPEEFLRETIGTWPKGVAEMLLDAWRATLGYSAFVTSAVQEIVGSPPRTFYQWALDYSSAFTQVEDR